MVYGEVVVDVGLDRLLLYGIPFILIAGWLSSRLLGVRRGWLRSAFAGLCGWVFGLVIAAIVSNQSVRTDAELNDVLALAFFFGIFVTMFVSLALELLLRPKVRRRRHWLRPILHPITTIKRRLAPLGRSARSSATPASGGWPGSARRPWRSWRRRSTPGASG